MQRWLLGNESRSKMFINLHLSHTKTGNNSVTHIGANMIFGGILEGVWPINNQSKFLLCDFSLDARVKVEQLDFSHSSITVGYIHTISGGGRRVMGD